MADQADDELAYLQPSFDPNSLTVARLRNILLTHEIKYPSSAKKADLVAIFTDQLKPKARKILADHRKIQRSSRGIEDATSSIASTQDPDEPPQTSPAKKSRGRPRKTAPAAAEEDVDETVVAPVSKSRRRTPGPTKKKSAEPVEDSARPKSRRSTTTPALKKEESDPATWREYTNESPFSSDNPFQSGSSPPTAAPSSRRRQTDGPAEETERKRKSVGRRKTDNPSTTVVRNTAVDIPLGKSYAQPDGGDAEAGEEFEPEEQLALEKDHRENPQAVIPVRRQQRRPANYGPLKTFLTTFTVVLAAISAGLYREEKFNVGYCGVGQPSDNIRGVDIPEWADVLRPNCEPCPPHATCKSKLETICDKDFVLKHHPLALGGLLPLPPTCEPDSEKAKRVKALADFAVDELRKASASAACEGKSAEIPEAELRATVMSRVRKNISPEDLDALFDLASEDMAKRDEIVETVDEATQRRIFKSTSTAKIGIICSIRLSLRGVVEQFFRQLVVLFAALLAASYAWLRARDHFATKAEAKQLASQVFHALADHAAWLVYEGAGDRDGYVSVNQLRDDVLRDEYSTSRRKRLWGQVEKLVEQNSNVRARVGSLDSGDVGRGWKWIGAIRALDDGGSGSSQTHSRNVSRRGSARFSLPAMPAATDSSPPMTELRKANGSPVMKFEKWDSGRPQF